MPFDASAPSPEVPSRKRSFKRGGSRVTAAATLTNPMDVRSRLASQRERSGWQGQKVIAGESSRHRVPGPGKKQKLHSAVDSDPWHSPYRQSGRRTRLEPAKTGWGISGLIAAFTLFDAVGKFVRPAQVVEAFARTAWPVELAPSLGAILILCATIFLIPQSSVLGAILLTGYLGGAVATNLRLHNPLFSHTSFPCTLAS